MSVTVPLRFVCPGLHFAGCPDKATLVMAIGTFARDGLSLDTLQKAMRKVGWILAASKEIVNGKESPEEVWAAFRAGLDGPGPLASVLPMVGSQGSSTPEGETNG